MNSTHRAVIAAYVRQNWKPKTVSLGDGRGLKIQNGVVNTNRGMILKNDMGNHHHCDVLRASVTAKWSRGVT
jgi:hypothetical protein